MIFDVDVGRDKLMHRMNYKILILCVVTFACCQSCHRDNQHNLQSIPDRFHGAYGKQSDDEVCFIIEDKTILPVMFPDACFMISSVQLIDDNTIRITSATSNNHNRKSEKFTLERNGDIISMRDFTDNDAIEPFHIELQLKCSVSQAYKRMGIAQQVDAPEPLTRPGDP